LEGLKWNENLTSTSVGDQQRQATNTTANRHTRPITATAKGGSNVLLSICHDTCWERPRSFHAVPSQVHNGGCEYYLPLLSPIRPSVRVFIAQINLDFH
jgi:hypothetical protein